MKKRIVAMLVAAVLCMGVTGALAAYGRGYVDADGDGVCDNCAGNWVDANGDGICDNCVGNCAGNRGSACGNWADADGDGVCDNYSGAGLNYGNGVAGGHHGQGMRAGCCGARG